MESSNEKKIEQANRCKASAADLQSHENTYDKAVDFVLKERRLVKFM